MKISFYKSGELNGPSYTKNSMRSSTMLNIENCDKYCFIWSIIARLSPCENSHPTKVKKYRQYFNEFINQDFDFSNRYKLTDVHKFEKNK